MKSSDLVVACLAENRPNWYRMVENLVISMRNFGGELAGAQFIAYFVEGVDLALGRNLVELGAELKVVARCDPARPTTNKLRMFQDFAARDDGRHLIALDCDTVIVGDFSEQVSETAVRAMQAGHSPLSRDAWTGLLTEFGLSPAATPITLLRDGEQVWVPYLNSGVLLVPAEHCAALADSWTAYTDEFTRQSKAGIDKPWTGYFLDQIALTCALLERDIPVELLSPGLNLPTAPKIRERLAARPDISIGLLHYHKNISADGLLLHSDAEVVNTLIDRLNAVIAARVGIETGESGVRAAVEDRISAVAGRLGTLSRNAIARTTKG